MRYLNVIHAQCKLTQQESHLLYRARFQDKSFSHFQSHLLIKNIYSPAKTNQKEPIFIYSLNQVKMF